MANELDISSHLEFIKGGIETAASRAARLTISGNDSVQKEVTIYTVEEILNLGDLGGNAGYILLENLDTTNFIEIRAKSGVADLVKIRAGKMALFELADNVTTTTISSSNYTATPASGTTITFSATAGIVIGDTIEITTASRRDFYKVTVVSANSEITVVGPALSEDITALKVIDGPYAIADTAACRLRITCIEK